MDIGWSVKADTSGNIIVTGEITGNVDLNGDGDSNDGGEDSTGYSEYDIFIATFDQDGNP